MSASSLQTPIAQYDCHVACVCLQLFHMSEEQVQNVEHEYEDNNSYTKEVCMYVWVYVCMCV